MIVDVHARCTPSAYTAMLARAGGSRRGEPYSTRAGVPAPPRSDDPADIERRLQLMDEAGVQMQVLSNPAGPYLANPAEAVEGARLINDSYSALARRYPDRFAAYAVLPLPHVDESLRELQRALDELGLCGVIMACSIQRTRSPAEAEFEPLYEELNRRGAALYYHPSGNGLCSPLLNDYGLTYAAGAPMEDTTLITHLMARGIPVRYPNIKIVVAHFGGAMPMLLHRLDHEAPPRVPSLLEPPSATARRLYYDTVGHGSTIALWAAWKAFGADHLGWQRLPDHPVFRAVRGKLRLHPSSRPARRGRSQDPQRQCRELARVEGLTVQASEAVVRSSAAALAAGAASGAAPKRGRSSRAARRTRDGSEDPPGPRPRPGRGSRPGGRSQTTDG
jgi:6-methylsalicylate decarboxylase